MTNHNTARELLCPRTGLYVNPDTMEIQCNKCGDWLPVVDFYGELFADEDCGCGIVRGTPHEDIEYSFAYVKKRVMP